MELATYIVDLAWTPPVVRAQRSELCPLGLPPAALKRLPPGSVPDLARLLLVTDPLPGRIGAHRWRAYKVRFVFEARDQGWVQGSDVGE